MANAITGSETTLQTKQASETAKNNVLGAINFIKNSKSKSPDDKRIAALLDFINQSLLKIKSLSLSDKEEIAISVKEDGSHKLQVPRTIAQKNSFLVYHNLLGYFLESAKKQKSEEFSGLELNDFTSALELVVTNAPPSPSATAQEDTRSFEERVLEILHDGPGPQDASELPPLEDPAGQNIKTRRLAMKPKVVKKYIKIYPDPKNELTYWRPFAQEIHAAVTTSDREGLAEILTDTLNSFSYILTKSKKKLSQERTESPDKYRSRIASKIADDFLKFLVKYINIHENGNAALKPFFTQCINSINPTKLDPPASLINFNSEVLSRFSRAHINAESAQLDQDDLLAIEDKDLLNAPRIGRSIAMSAARLGITDQTGGRRSAVALLGTNSAAKATPNSKELDLNMEFVSQSASYGFQFESLKQSILDALTKAIQADSENLAEFLPEEIMGFLDTAMRRDSDDSKVSLVASEAKELLKLFAVICESKEMKALLSKNRIELSPTQFFVSQIFFKYFKIPAHVQEKKAFYLPILNDLESNYAQFNGITALISEVEVESGSDLEKAIANETKAELANARSYRIKSRSSFIKTCSGNPNASVGNVLSKAPALTQDEQKEYRKDQGIKTFLARLASPELTSSQNSLVIDNDLEEYKTDFIELITGIKVLSPLNMVGKVTNHQVPIAINNQIRLIDPDDLQELVKFILTKKLMPAVHLDKGAQGLIKALPGLDDINEFASSLYEFLNSRQDLLDIGTAWSDQESKKIKALASSAQEALGRSKKHLSEQTVTMDKARETKLEQTAQSSQAAQEELQGLREEVHGLKEVIVDLIGLLKSPQKPDDETLDLLMARVSDSSGSDTQLDFGGDTKLDLTKAQKAK